MENLKKNMDSKNEPFEVEFTEQCVEEMTTIYDYISTQLKEDKAAQNLISIVNEKILDLSKAPELYMKIGKVDRLKREYHRIVVKNYVVLYTIDYEKRKVYISRMMYGRKNYLS